MMYCVTKRYESLNRSICSADHNKEKAIFFWLTQLYMSIYIKLSIMYHKNCGFEKRIDDITTATFSVISI